MRTNELLIGLAEIVVISVDDFLRPLEHLRSFLELLHEHVADSQVDESEGIGGVELYGLLIVLDGLWIILVLFVDIAKVVVGITVPGVDFC